MVIFTILQVFVREKVIQKINLIPLPPKFDQAASSVVPDLIVFWIVAGKLRDPSQLGFPVEPQRFYALPEEERGVRQAQVKSQKGSLLEFCQVEGNNWDPLHLLGCQHTRVHT